MTDSAFSLVVSMLNVGGLLGALLAPRFSDRFGRRLTLFGNNAFLFLGSLSMGVANNLYVLLWGRFLVGVGSGIITVVCSTYISECVPDHLRISETLRHIVRVQDHGGRRYGTCEGAAACFVDAGKKNLCHDLPLEDSPGEFQPENRSRPRHNS